MKTVILTAVTLASLLGLPLGNFAQTSEKKDTLTIPKGKIGLIGYGSLMSKSSMEKTLERPYHDNYLQVHIDGYERIWNKGQLNGKDTGPRVYYLEQNDTIYPKYLIALNIQPSKKKSLNACLFIIEESELQLFDKREIGYERINVADRIKEFKIKGSVYAYIALPEFTINVTSNPKNNIIGKRYLDIVESSFDFGEKFKMEFFKTTVPYNPRIVKLGTIKTHQH